MGLMSVRYPGHPHSCNGTQKEASSPGAQGVSELDRPRCVEVDLRVVVEITQLVRASELVDQRTERGVAVALVTIVHDRRLR